MDDNKFELILNILLERTKKDELNWKATASPSTYLLVLNDSSITIDADVIIETFKFNFRNEKGEIVETVYVDKYKDEGRLHKTTELYDLAKRKALKSDETIDKIIKQLSPKSLTA